ncbi:LacI family transcriptional regulator, purine nucleotide synthesis repressor [Lachnospiraceae bacterium NK3A20]|nr:LacI family transcriptional regulator, purine nucleotide synthesis repressor [Lachnospiraceae bacterium NK3A20]
MVSLKDIAAACGVSVATVSKALNNHNDVSDATKERIRKTAMELGYMPNSAAKALKTNRTYSIGILFVDEAQSGLTHDYYAALLDSFKRTAESMGYDLTFINCNKTRANNMSYLAHARYRNFDGVCIACVDFYDPEVVELVRSDIPIVTIDHVFNNRMVVLSDNVQGIRDLVKYIYKMGHRKIAYIHGADSAVTQSRLSSFYKTTYELGLSIPDEYICEAPYRSTDETYRQTKKLLQLPDPPTCILYPDDFAAFGGINAIRSLGLRIPEDISVAGYDGIRIGRHILPRLTTIRQDTETIGGKAARMLISLIEHPKTTLVETAMVEGSLYEGETVAKLDDHADA